MTEQTPGSPRDLSAYIAQQTPQTVSVDFATGFALDPAGQAVEGQAPETLSDGQPAGESTSDARAPITATTTTTQQPEGVTTPPDAAWQAEKAQYEARLAQIQAEAHQARKDAEQTRAVLQQQANAAAQAEEARFLQSIEALDPQDRAERLLAYRDQQYRAREAFLTGQLNAVAQREEAKAQEAAKAQVAYILAERNGIPSQYFDVLKSQNDPDSMAALAEKLGAIFKSSSPSVPNPAVPSGPATNPAVFTPSGGEPTAPPEGPKKRSGDLVGLIASRGYERAVVR